MYFIKSTPFHCLLLTWLVRPQKYLLYSLKESPSITTEAHNIYSLLARRIRTSGIVCNLENEDQFHSIPSSHASTVDKYMHFLIQLISENMVRSFAKSAK